MGAEERAAGRLRVAVAAPLSEENRARIRELEPRIDLVVVDALDSGRVGFAALDVFETEPLPADSPLWDHDHVPVSPHTAALNTAEDRLIAEFFAANSTRLLDGHCLLNRVNTVEFYRPVTTVALH